MENLSGLDIRLNKVATEETIREENPDALFIATGSADLCDTAIEGLEESLFLTPSDILGGEVSPGSKVFIIGGGSVGCEVGLYLAKKDCSVTIAEALTSAARDLFDANRQMLLNLLDEHGVQLFTETPVKNVTPDGVVAETEEGETVFPYDVLVLAVGRMPENKLVEVAERWVEDVYMVGDSLAPRRIKEAIWEAFKWARIT